jgi:hypothetical protein
MITDLPQLSGLLSRYDHFGPGLLGFDLSGKPAERNARLFAGCGKQVRCCDPILRPRYQRSPASAIDCDLRRLPDLGGRETKAAGERSNGLRSMPPPLFRSSVAVPWPVANSPQWLIQSDQRRSVTAATISRVALQDVAVDSVPAILLSDCTICGM